MSYFLMNDKNEYRRIILIGIDTSFLNVEGCKSITEQLKNILQIDDVIFLPGVKGVYYCEEKI